MLSGCASDRPSQEVNLTVSGCPKITRCQLDPAAPRTNGDLLALLDETEGRSCRARRRQKRGAAYLCRRAVFRRLRACTTAAALSRPASLVWPVRTDRSWSAVRRT
ncbi:Rz1-like lysis system protein LysC [Pantoea agglomerans]|uniref:Rz1-like lysis system protein LysC n=1 Tax=Enterobacter agglomerans TaxID=549 RepID=UPI003209821F